MRYVQRVSGCVQAGAAHLQPCTHADLMGFQPSVLACSVFDTDRYFDTFTSRFPAKPSPPEDRQSQIWSRPHSPVPGDKSEIEFKRKLTLPSAASRSDLAETERITDVGSGCSEYMSIESIKHLEAQFDVHLFPYVGPLHDPEILVVGGESSDVED